jgi:hypothetical protein
MGIRKNDLVLLDVDLLRRTLNSKSVALVEGQNRKVLLKVALNGARPVGTVLSTRTKEHIAEADSHSKVYVVTTADVVWPEGFVKNCPVEVLIKVTNEI